ncbi:MAG: RNA-binding domain-containing protein, partial [Halobacteria archaeon]|nr:RNA-binding domain-containing protein [Halobacteria archaeon]
MSGSQRTYRANVTVRVPVYPTEVADRVEESVLNLFPDADTELEESDASVPGRAERTLVASTHSVEALAERVVEQEINEATRSELLGSVVGDAVRFSLKKQAAYVGRLNFDVGGHELGALDVHIETDDPEKLVDVIAPRVEPED